jgi:hypothetical protein
MTPGELKAAIKAVNKKRAHGEGKLYPTSGGKKVAFTYQLEGKQIRVTERTGGFSGDDPKEALEVLKERIRDKEAKERGERPLSIVELQQITVGELCDSYIRSQEIEGKRDVRHARYRANLLKVRFGTLAAVAMSSAKWDEFIDECRNFPRCRFRGGQGKGHDSARCKSEDHLTTLEDASINRYQEVLSAALKYARRTVPGFSHAPFLRHLKEDNVRRTLLPWSVWQKIAPTVKGTSEDAFDWMEFFLLSGLRPVTVQQMEWPSLDMSEPNRWSYFIEGKIDKSNNPRSYVIEGIQREVIERRLKRRRPGVSWIFHRDGERLNYEWIREFVYYPALLEHGERTGRDGGFVLYDGKKTAMTTDTAAGVPIQRTMKRSGHKTQKSAERYVITDSAMQDELRRDVRQRDEYVRNVLEFSKDSAKVDENAN